MISINDAGKDLGIDFNITENGEKANTTVTIHRIFWVIVISFSGLAVQWLIGFKSDFILWLIFASVSVTGAMLLGGQSQAGNITNDILLSIHKEIKQKDSTLVE